MQLRDSIYNFEFEDSKGRNCIYNCNNEKYMKLGKYTLKDLLNDTNLENKKILLNKGYLVDDNHMKKMEEGFEEIKRKRNKLSLVISLTENCNFSCTYCYQSEQDYVNNETRRMSKLVEENLIRFIEINIKGYKRLHICWFGGEPLIEIDLIKRLTEKIEKIGQEYNCLISYEMISNGYLLSADLGEYFSKQNFKRIQITFDGAENVHNRFRLLKDGRGSFDRILENVSMISSYIHITIRVNIQKENVESAKELIRLLEERGLSKKVGLYFAPVEDFCESTCSSNNNILSYKDFAKIHIQLVKYARQHGFSQKTIISTVKRTFCGVNSVSDYYINSKGDLYKCEHLMSQQRDSIGNVLSGIHTDQLLRFIEYSPFSIEECRKCPYLPKCWGGCYFKRNYLKNNWCPYWKYNFVELANEEYRKLEEEND